MEDGLNLFHLLSFMMTMLMLISGLVQTYIC
jgi:hypothetical protein